MEKKENVRELVTDMVVEITAGREKSHILIRNVLDKYNYLPGYDKSFIKKVTEGTLERMITIDYVINQFSKVPVNKMKPFIRSLMRMSVYQILYLDKVPAAEAIEEMAADLLNGRREKATTVRDEILHTVACQAAIKAGWKNDEAELLAVAKEVMAREDLKHCPHGRPICITLSKKQLEKQFKRA